LRLQTTIAQFVSEDPIGFAGDPTNLYRYVGNRPVQYTDPNSLEKIWFEFHGFIPGKDGVKFPAKHEHNRVDGTWLAAPDLWYYATDNRGFGGGSSRVHYRGWIESTKIGKIGDGDWEARSGTSGSTRVREVNDESLGGGWELVKEQMDSKVRGSAQKHNGNDGTVIRITATGGDPFLEPFAPNLDFTVDFRFDCDPKRPDKVRVTVNGTHDAYPSFEAIVTTAASSLRSPIYVGTSLYKADQPFKSFFSSLVVGLNTTMMFKGRTEYVDATPPNW
jgi:hypothetical protein